MKRTILFVVLFFIGQLVIAQGTNPYSLKRLRFGFEPTVDFWLKAPSDIDLKLLQRGASFHLMYEQPIKESKFSLCGGLSVASHNLYSNGRLKVNNEGNSYFLAIHDTIVYTKNKFSFTYLDIPVELKYKTNSHINFALGLRAGLMINDHTKYVGEDYLSGGTRDIKVKFANNANIMNYRLGAYAVLGYRWANVKFGYSFTKLFEKDKGPNMSPMTFGLLIRPY
ncbi:MAG: outer membrane beta-barrel protein [Bacteroidales bacterium]|nr:outer membrane beta-barrel protein [Bacteroidales bacterium]MDZ4205116.1 outer membrane beta-barrel protein [Bacteroidales bacterium]